MGVPLRSPSFALTFLDKTEKKDIKPRFKKMFDEVV